MNIQEIYKKTKAGTIKIDTKGHFVNPIEDILEWTIESLLESVESKDLGKSTKRFCKAKLDYKHEVGSIVTLDDSIYCFDCGCNMNVYLADENTLSIIDRKTYYARQKELKSHDAPVDNTLVLDCYMKEQRASGKTVTEIEFPTGAVIFKNYFNQKEIYECPTYHSINDIKGRIELANYLATKNVGYGQMGNMSTNVYVNTDGTEIILAGSYYYDEENDIEHEVSFEGFEPVGSISLSVWRWMCADRATLQKYKEDTIEQDHNISVAKHATYTQDYQDIVELIVKPGKWTVEHYYDFEDRKDQIHSKLFLQK